MADLALYRHGKQKLVKLVSGLDEAELGRTCRACPEWTIRDVVAHHIHFLGAFLAEEVPPTMFDAIVEPDPQARQRASDDRNAWTEAGVAARRPLPLAEVLGEWDRLESSMSERGAQTMVDLTMHIYDITETLGDAACDSSLVEDALRGYHKFQSARLKRLALPPVTLVRKDTGTTIERDGAASSVGGASYDLLRCIGGRRSRGQADSLLDWGDTAEAVRRYFSVYGWA